MITQKKAFDPPGAFKTDLEKQRFVQLFTKGMCLEKEAPEGIFNQEALPIQYPPYLWEEIKKFVSEWMDKIQDPMKSCVPNFDGLTGSVIITVDYDDGNTALLKMRRIWPTAIDMDERIVHYSVIAVGS